MAAATSSAVSTCPCQHDSHYIIQPGFTPETIEAQRDRMESESEVFKKSPTIRVWTDSCNPEKVEILKGVVDAWREAYFPGATIAVTPVSVSASRCQNLKSYIRENVVQGTWLRLQELKDKVARYYSLDQKQEILHLFITVNNQIHSKPVCPHHPPASFPEGSFDKKTSLGRYNAYAVGAELYARGISMYQVNISLELLMPTRCKDLDKADSNLGIDGEADENKRNRNASPNDCNETNWIADARYKDPDILRTEALRLALGLYEF